MERPIIGFRTDEEGHWVALLGCGHAQHVRDDPPLVERPWVTTAKGRDRRLGQYLVPNTRSRLASDERWPGVFEQLLIAAGHRVRVIEDCLNVAAPPFRSPKGPIAPKFAGAEDKCAGLAEAFAQVAADEQCAFFDAATVTTTSPEDGVHLDAARHAVLGRAIARAVEGLFPNLLARRSER